MFSNERQTSPRFHLLPPWLFNTNVVLIYHSILYFFCGCETWAVWPAGCGRSQWAADHDAGVGQRENPSSGTPIALN